MVHGSLRQHGLAESFGEATRSPDLNRVTLPPTSITSPAASVPGTAFMGSSKVDSSGQVGQHVFMSGWRVSSAWNALRWGPGRRLGA